MPLVRFKIRNELSLGGPELNRSAAVEDEEPKAILGAVEVAGLIGILRQFGDLAEFSAEVFNGIQEEVTVTVSKCQKLTSRVRRIESALSPLEKAVLSQTSHIHFAYAGGCEWHPRIRNGHSHFIQSDLPLCVMETYEQCRDPPPLHQLDRFDVGGPGSCLRRYSDPTFFRKELSKLSKADDIKVQRDQVHVKRKKKRLPQRNICRSRAVSTSDETNGARLSSATDDRQTTSQSTSTVDMPRSSNIQDLSDIIDQSHLQGQSDALEESEAQEQSDFQDSPKARESITGTGYIEYVINQTPVNKLEAKLVEGFLSGSLQPADRIDSAVSEHCVEDVDDDILYSPSQDLHVPCGSIFCDEKKETIELMVDKSSKDKKEIHESKFGPGTPDRVRQNEREFGRTHIFNEVDIVGERQNKSQANNTDGTLGYENEGESKSEQESEADEFVDASNTIESESESDLDGVPKPKLEHYFGDISTYCSEEANSDDNDGSEDTPYEKMAHDPCYENSLDESCSGSDFPEDANVSCCLSDPVCVKTLSHDETFQNSREFFAMRPSLLAKEAFPEVTILREEPVAIHPLLAGDYASEKISSEEPLSSGSYLKDAITAEKTLTEEHLATYSSLVEAVSHEKIPPGESVAKYLSVAEIVPHEKILPEKSLPRIPSLAEAAPDSMTPSKEPDAAHPPFPKAFQDKKTSPGLDLKKLFAPEAVSQEQISLEKFVGIYPCLAEVVPDERFLTEEPEEPATPCLSSTKALPVENLLPEKPLEAYHYLAESPKEKILEERSVDSAHSSCANAAPEANLSLEVIDSPNFSVAESIPEEQIALKELVAVYPCVAEAIPDERVLLEEPVTADLSLAKAVTIEKVLPDELFETYPSMAELPEENISYEETDYATHPSEAKAVSDENISPEVPDYPNLSLEETLPQEQISLEDIVGINPCLAEAVPDEKFSPEEPVTTCLCLTKVATVEGVLTENRMETYSSLADLPEEKILHEEADVGAHPSLSEAVSDEQISVDVLGSSNLQVAEAVPQEQKVLEEFVGIDPCLAEAAPDKGILSEELVTTCMSLTKEVPIEEVLPEEPLEAYASLEKLSNDKISQEKSDDATYPSCAKSESDEKILPVEPLKVYPSLEELLEEKISQEELDDTTHPYISEAVDDEKISPIEGTASTYPSLEESVPHKKTSHEELVGTNPFVERVVSNERNFPEEPGVTYQSLAEAVSKENNLPEELLRTCPSLSEAIPDENTSLEELDASCSPSVEAVFDEKLSGSEAPGPTTEIGPYNKTVPEEHVASLAEPVPDENILPKEPAAAYLDLAEGIPDQKVFLDDAAFLSFAEAIFDQKFSPDLVIHLPAKNTLEPESDDVSLDQKSGFLEPESADRTIPSSGGTVTISPDTQGSLPNGTIVESVSIWSNGGLLGLAPSKPPVLAEPKSVSEHIHNEIDEASVLATRKQESSSRSVEDTKKSSLSLVVPDPKSQLQSNMLSHSNGSLSHLQSSATSFKVFGLSHRLLMAGFRGNPSSPCKFESIPTSSYYTEVAAIKDKTQQALDGSSFEERLDYESSLFGSPTSSPPVQHMKISFSPIDPSPIFKLKLRIPCQTQYTGENADMFPSFQLVPEASNSDDDDNNNIFCQSSPCFSDNCLSDSELWESDESPSKCASSLKEVGERSTHGDMSSFSGSFLDLPCFDSVDYQSTSSRLVQEQEEEQLEEYKLSVSEITVIGHQTNQKSVPKNEANANANAVLKDC